MALVAASISCSTYEPYSPRINKKKKIKVSLDNIHQTWILHSIGDHMNDTTKRQWEKEVRRVSLSSLPQIKSMEDKITRSDGCIACATNRVDQQLQKGGSPSLRKAVISRQAQSVDSCVSTPGNTPTKCHKNHSHSDFCLKECVHKRHSAGHVDEHHHHHHKLPEINIVSSHSSLKCGTNIKSWTVKVDVRPYTPKGEVLVSAEGQCVKIKAKEHKLKGLAYIFGHASRETKRTLKFAGIVETKSLRTHTDKEGFLTIDLYEYLPY